MSDIERSENERIAINLAAFGAEYKGNSETGFWFPRVMEAIKAALDQKDAEHEKERHNWFDAGVAIQQTIESLKLQLENEEAAHAEELAALKSSHEAEVARLKTELTYRILFEAQRNGAKAVLKALKETEDRDGRSKAS